MRTINRRGLDPGLVFVLALTLFHAIPLAMNAGLPDGSELLYHFSRVTELTRSWEQGLFLPDDSQAVDRANSPSAYHLNASLIYHLSSVLHLVFGLSVLDALRWLVLLSFLGCSGGMYLFCKRRSGRLGAVIAGLLYVYSPYLMVTVAYARGAYPELLALALFPLLLWRLDALRDKPNGFNFILAVILQAVIFATDGMMALVMTAIALAWITFETLIQYINREASRINPRSGGLALIALLLGALAAAASLLPFIVEDDSANRNRPTYARQLDRGEETVRLEELLSPPPINDAGAINGLREEHRLGIAQWGLTLLGAATALLNYVIGFRTRHPQALLGTLFFALLAVALVALISPSAAGLWADSGPLRQLQHPVRMLGPIAACLAIVAGANGFWLERLEARFQISTVALLVALPIVTAIPLFYVAEWRFQTVDDMLAAQPAQQLTAMAQDRNGAAAVVIGVLSLAVAIIIAWAISRRQQTPRPFWTTPRLTRSALIGIAFGGLMACLVLLVTFREGVAWLNSPPGEALPAQVRLGYTLDGKLQLLGYDLNSERLRPGDRLSLDAYWYALEETDIDFSSFLHLSSGGPPHAQIDKLHPGGRAISEWWSPAGYILDSYQLQIPTDLPAGDYDLIIGLYTCALMPPDDCGNGYRPTVTDENGERIGDQIKLATVRVESR